MQQRSFWMAMMILIWSMIVFDNGFFLLAIVCLFDSPIRMERDLKKGLP